jgi:hypothetical protein
LGPQPNRSERDGDDSRSDDGEPWAAGRLIEDPPDADHDGNVRGGDEPREQGVDERSVHDEVDVDDAVAKNRDRDGDEQQHQCGTPRSETHGGPR